MIKIANETLTAIIHEKGAELQSLQYNNLEYLWQADANYWAKHAPALFPIVGQLKNDIYKFNGKEYKLPRHGFARDKMFKGEQTSPASAAFTLKNNEDTFAVYPFRFIFQIEYTIKENELFCTYHVQNSGDDIMYFSVGGHPAFNVPLNTNLRYTDYDLEFEDDDILKRYLLNDGLINNETEPIELADKALHLKPELFYEDAIVLKEINSKQITLKTNKDPHGLNFKFDGFPYFGIWASRDAPFVCLEPWCGIADNIHHNNELIKKEGIHELIPGERWQRTWSVELF